MPVSGSGPKLAALGAGAGASAAAFSVFGPLGLVAGAALAVFAAHQANRAVTKQAEVQFEQTRRAKIDVKVNRDLETNRLSRAIQAQHGQQSVRLGPVTGSNALLLGNIAAEGGDAQSSLLLQAERSASQLREQDRLIAMGANSQMKDPMIAAISGAVDGFMMGSQIDNAIQAGKDMEDAADRAGKLGKAQLDNQRMQARLGSQKHQDEVSLVNYQFATQGVGQATLNSLGIGIATQLSGFLFNSAAAASGNFKQVSQ